MSQRAATIWPTSRPWANSSGTSRRTKETSTAIRMCRGRPVRVPRSGSSPAVRPFPRSGPESSSMVRPRYADQTGTPYGDAEGESHGGTIGNVRGTERKEGCVAETRVGEWRRRFAHSRSGGSCPGRHVDLSLRERGASCPTRRFGGSAHGEPGDRSRFNPNGTVALSRAARREASDGPRISY
jgi:hypothetical protein